MNLKPFICPKCGGTKLKEIVDGAIIESEVIGFHLEKDILELDYGEECNNGGAVPYYKCANCEKVIAESDSELIEFLTQGLDNEKE